MSNLYLSMILILQDKINTDMVLYFPNNFMGNTEWLSEGECIENLEFDNYGRVKTDYHQRSDHKRIFAAGDCSASIYFAHGQRVNSCFSVSILNKFKCIACL